MYDLHDICISSNIRCISSNIRCMTCMGIGRGFRNKHWPRAVTEQTHTCINTPPLHWTLCMYTRAHWQIFFFHFNFWLFTYLHLLSGLQGRICQKIYDGWKKYFGLTNVSFQCHTSSWNTPITIRKWFQTFTKVSGSPIFHLLKSANLGNFHQYW